VEKVVDQLRRRGVEAGRLFEVGEAGLRDVPRRAEGEQERALARRADAGDFVERALDEFALAPCAVGSDGEAVGLVAQALDEEEGRIARAEPERFAPLDEESLVAGVAVGALGDRDQPHPLDAEPSQNFARGENGDRKTVTVASLPFLLCWLNMHVSPISDSLIRTDSLISNFTDFTDFPGTVASRA
jgi:hypothetical protein